jgi:colanic acid biosynthesis glycosyl transferase WcaI
LRFLILTQYFTPEIGAPQLRLRALVRALKNFGHEVEMVTALPNYPVGKISDAYRGCFYRCEQIDGVKVHRVWLYAAIGAGLSRILNYLSFTLFSLWALGRCRRPDFVFVESPPLFLAIPGYVIAARWKAKMIFNVADLWPDSIKELGLIQDGRILAFAESLEKWSYRVSYRVSAVTEGIRQSLREKGVPETKLLFLPNGVDMELFQPRPPDKELSRNLDLEGKKIILYAGTLGYAQGLDTVLGAAKIISNIEGTVIIFIGGGADKPRLADLAQREGLKNVRFLDPAPPEFVARLYSLSLAGLAVLRDLPLFKGARPSKIFPSMASGVPVLYSGAGEGAGLVEEAQAGITIPPENPQALAEGIKRLLEDPDWARQLGLNGRKYVESNLSWPVLVKDWLEQLLN